MMKRNIRATGGPRGASGQAIYQTMLIIAAVALAVAIFFPVYEYVELQRGEVPLYKFDRSARLPGQRAAQPKARPAEAEEAKEAGEAEEAGGEAPEPVEETQPEAGAEGGG